MVVTEGNYQLQGYGARQLWSDESIVPVRGQIAWLIPQEGVHYGLNYKSLNVWRAGMESSYDQRPVARTSAGNNTNEQADRAAAEAGVLELQEL